MSEALAALIDVERLRGIGVPILSLLQPPGPTVVLGSTQAVSDLDVGRLDAEAVSLARRRGGGGAVLLRPGDVWIELWLPRSTVVAPDDVRATAYRVGRWWTVALARLGLGVQMHEGDVLEAAQGAIACFAGLGPGELTFDGRKLVGLSQWRSREGVLVSTVVSAHPPVDLAAYLSSGIAAVPALVAARCLRDVADGLRASDVADELLAAAHEELPSLRADPHAFH